MQIGQLLGRQNEREIYLRVSRAEMDKKRKEIGLVKAYRIEQRQTKERLVKIARREELIRMGFNPPEVA